MSARFEELDWRRTPMGAISLRRRRDPASGADVFEVKLDDEYLMSSLFTVAEIELARLGLAALPGTDLDVVVGGLGLGYTACAVLDDPRVRSLVVVEAHEDVVGWHRRGLLPFAARLTTDPRSRLVHADFFAAAAAGAEAGATAEAEEAAAAEADGAGGLGPAHAILVDIDHSPRHLLHPGHGGFYRPDGLRRLIRHLRPGGVFGLWSNDPPDEEFGAVLGQVFGTWRAHVVTFPNPVRGGESANTVYVATRAAP